MKLDPYHWSYIEPSSKWLKDFDVKPETSKLLKKIIAPNHL